MATYNFNELTYSKLQAECKARGIKASGKTLELIQRLEQYELANGVTVTQQEETITNSINDIPALDFFSSVNLGATNNVSETTNNTTTVTKVEKIDTVVKTEIPPQPKQTSVNTTSIYKLEDHISKIAVHLNHERVMDAAIKQECLTYVNEVVAFFLSYDANRVIREVPPTDQIYSIDINMNEAWLWQQTQSDSWVKRPVKAQKRTPLLNRKKTDFVASIPGKVENAVFSNGKDDKTVFFKPYQHLQKFDPDTQRYVQTAKPVLCPYVSLIKVNDQVILGTLGKLKGDLDKEPTTKRALSVDRVRSGYLNNWSQVFSWSIDYHDKFSDLFPEDQLAPNKVRLQVAIEGADQLNLYKVTDYIKYQDRYDGKTRNTSEVSRSKLCTLATLQIIKFPQYVWKANSYRYEKIADYLNKHIDATSKKLNDIFSTSFSGIELTDDTCKIGDRILCQRYYLGEQVMVRSVLNPSFMDGRQVKQECLWLEQLRQKVQQMIINKSALIIADQMNDYDKLKEHNVDIKKAEKSTKRLLSSIKSLLNNHGYDTNLINDYASLLLTYFIVDCKFEQLQIAALIAKKYKLIADSEIPLEDKVLGLDPNKIRKQALQELIDQLLNKEVPDRDVLWTKNDVLYRHKEQSNKRTRLTNKIA